MSITVHVPATSANLGPGFDCLGLSLTLSNRITLSEQETPLTIQISGEGADWLPRDTHNLVWQAACKVFDLVGRWPVGVMMQLENRIPAGSGLGSSAAAVVGGLVAANALVKGGLTPETLLQLATEMEGHPDNVAPALFGGLTLINQTDTGLHLERIPLPPLQVVIVLPAFDLPTVQARAALPRQIARQDAIFNIGRMGLLLRALPAGDYAKLRVAMQDRLHQPYRLPLVPGLAAAFAAAYTAGAAAVALSGAGPSLIAFAPVGHEQIGIACAAAFAQAGLDSRTWVLYVDTAGTQICTE
ncbi:MAG: homoserine kinase [Chloroflexi bacterium]|nr:homoserine kinase [Chloroflexota bacterium]MBP8054298.1 homoserine kinase [Chloroflexota bacterium]